MKWWPDPMCWTQGGNLLLLIAVVGVAFFLLVVLFEVVRDTCRGIAAREMFRRFVKTVAVTVIVWVSLLVFMFVLAYAATQAYCFYEWAVS